MKIDMKKPDTQLSLGVILMIAGMTLSVLGNIVVLFATYQLAGAEEISPDAIQTLSSYESLLRIVWLVSGLVFIPGLVIALRAYMKRRQK